jgi:3-deoxy-manno-octulosonate cytidylyltransferase (CMP-KDO synthetase)
MSRRVVGIIPARLESTRLPRKLLRDLAGRPLLAWVYEAAARCPQFAQVVVAADSEEVAQLCERIGASCLLTAPELPSGTDRMHAVSRHIDAEIYVNVQGDEPMLRPEHIDSLLAPFALPHVDVTTLKVRCTPENVDNPNAVKVVTASDGRALYFSRATIPYDRDASLAATPSAVERWKHLGLYAYRKAALERFVALPPSALEQTERLEQLRLLENGLSLYVGETAYDTIGIDTEEDLIRVNRLLSTAAPV